MINRIIKNKLTMRFLLVMLVNVGGIGCGFLLQLYLTNTLDISTYGSYIYHMTILNFMVIAVKGGLDLAANRYIPVFINESDGGRYNAYIRFSTLYVFLSSLVAIAVCYFLKGIIWSGASSKLYFDLIAVAVSVLAFLQLQCGFLQAMQQAVLSQFIQNILRPLLVFVMTFCWIFYSPELNDYDLLVVVILVLVLLVIIANIFFRIKSKEQFGKVQEAPIEIRVWLFSAYGMGAVVLFNLVINQFDVLFIGYYLSSEDAAIYNVALRLASLVQFPAVALGLVLAPQISKLWAEKNVIKIEKTIHIGAMACLGLSSGLSILILVKADFLLNLFGSEYIAGRDALVILCIARCVNSFGGLAGYLMTMTGYQNISMKVLLVSALFSITSNIVLVTNLGPYGGAIANLMSTVFWIILMSVMAVKYLKVSPLFFYRCQSWRRLALWRQ